jgi:hypothetical protein
MWDSQELKSALKEALGGALSKSLHKEWAR